jgi:hypothetical protein
MATKLYLNTSSYFIQEYMFFLKHNYVCCALFLRLYTCVPSCNAPVSVRDVYKHTVSTVLGCTQAL